MMLRPPGTCSSTCHLTVALVGSLGKCREGNSVRNVGETQVTWKPLGMPRKLFLPAHDRAPWCKIVPLQPEENP
jgi:hypothetical protein